MHLIKSHLIFAFKMKYLGFGTISTVDLPMRIVLRVDRESLGLKDGGEPFIAWVKPEECALL